MAKSSAENDLGDGKPNKIQECRIATKIQTSLMQTQGTTEVRETPNGDRSKLQLGCQMSGSPMEIYGIHSDNNSGYAREMAVAKHNM